MLDTHRLKIFISVAELKSFSKAAKALYLTQPTVSQHITTLVDARRSAGTHTIEWDGNDKGNNPVATGIYFYRLNSGNITVSKKMLLLK